MKSSPKKIALMTTLAAAMGAWAWGAPLLFSGDVDADGSHTVADVIALENILSGGTAIGLQAALADVNQDGATDAADTTLLVDLTLKRQEPLPLIEMSLVVGVSYWKVQEPLTAEDAALAVVEQQVSFWKPMEPLTTANASITIAEEPVSFWKMMDINSVEVRDDNAVQIGPPSFDRLVE